MLDTAEIYTRLDRTVQTLLEVMCGAKGHCLVGTVILGLLTIFKNCQALSTFEALEFTSLSRCQRDVSPLVHMRWRPRAFCRVSTGDSDILSFCDMKDDPAFKPQQRYSSFFRVRASPCPFHLKQKTEGP